MMKWFEVDEKERIKNFYSKYSIEMFWDWWSDGEERFMEVRIVDYNLIKQLHNMSGLPYSTSGVYVKSAKELKSVIAFTRNKATTWFGINPRKKNHKGKKGWKTFGCGDGGGSSDDNVDSIAFLFIDIDRKIKDSPASNEELKRCDIMANHILDALSKESWNKGYAKICSGNGVQLLIKLDVPIKIPDRIFNSETFTFNHHDEFDMLKKILKQGIGNSIIKFVKKYEPELRVELDRKVFNLSRVGALPITKNYKYNGFTWRGLVELKDEVNEGLSDYIMSKELNIVQFKEKNAFQKSTLDPNLKLTETNFKRNKIVRLMMDNQLPYGELNNNLWFQLKCLIRDSKFDMNGKVFKKFHQELQKKYRGKFTTNLPKPEFGFDRNIVNSFCIKHSYEPIYSLWKKRTREIDVRLERLDWDMKDGYAETIKLDDDTTILQDLDKLKEILVIGADTNVFKVAGFINAAIEKYGEKKTKYFYDYIIVKYLSYE